MYSLSRRPLLLLGAAALAWSCSAAAAQDNAAPETDIEPLKVRLFLHLNQPLTMAPPTAETPNPLDAPFWAVLKMALEHSGRPYDLQVSPHARAPGRDVQLMMRYGDEANVLWEAADEKFDGPLLPVHIPIQGDLGAYRMPWTKIGSAEKFADVKTAEDLEGFTYVGPYPSTYPGLRAVGLTIFEVAPANVAKVVAEGRADFLTWGYTDDPETYASRRSRGLEPVEHLLIRQPRANYLYVHPDFPELHAAIEEGFKRASKAALIWPIC